MTVHCFATNISPKITNSHSKNARHNEWPQAFAWFRLLCEGENMKKIICICLLAFCILQAYAKEKEDPKSMAEHYGIKDIHKGIAMHYETMDQKKQPKEIVNRA